MGAVVIVITFVLVVLVAVVVGLALRRRGGDEVHSVEIVDIEPAPGDRT